jgi:phosphoglycerate dehydrogenase-like enzyme
MSNMSNPRVIRSEKIHIGIFHALHDEAKRYLTDQLTNIPHISFKIFPRITPDMIMSVEMEETIRTAEILMGFYFPLNYLAKADRVKLIISPFAGVSPLVQGIKKLRQETPHFSQVTLTNSHGNARFVAQHALALLFTLTNKIIHHHKQMEAGIWHFKQEEEETIPLFGKTFGLLGYGQINQHIHQYLAGFPCRFAALRNSWDKPPHNYPTELHKFRTDQLHEFLGAIDILFIALPLTAHTKHLIGDTELTKLRKGAILINLARGPIIQEQALFEALKSHKILGACLDVWWEYNPKPDREGKLYPYHFPFHELSNIVLSPHRADSPFYELSRWEDILDNVRKYVNGDKNYSNIVDINQGY